MKIAKSSKAGKKYPLDRAKIARLEERLRELLARNEDNAWECGKIFDELVRAGASSQGFDSVATYADTKFTQGYRTLRRYRRIALTFSKKTTMLHGVTKLDLGLRFIKAIGRSAEPYALLGVKIPVPIDANHTREVEFAKATATELTVAIREAQAKPQAFEPAVIRRAKKWQELLQTAVASPEGKNQHAPSVRAHPHPTRAGLVRFDLIGIDANDLERVARALLAEARRESKAFTSAAHAIS